MASKCGSETRERVVRLFRKPCRLGDGCRGTSGVLGRYEIGVGASGQGVSERTGVSDRGATNADYDGLDVEDGANHFAWMGALVLELGLFIGWGVLPLEIIHI